MVKIYLKNSEENQKLVGKASKKFNIKEEDIVLAASDKFLFSDVFLLAIANKKLYLKSTDSKKIQAFDTSDVIGVIVENKVDLNLYFKDGHFVNLTSIMSVSKGAQNVLKTLNDCISENK